MVHIIRTKIVGPYFINEKYRGKKLSTFLVNKCINEFEMEYKSAFDFIQKNNIASIKTTETYGFQYIYMMVSIQNILEY